MRKDKTGEKSHGIGVGVIGLYYGLLYNSRFCGSNRKRDSYFWKREYIKLQELHLCALLLNLKEMRRKHTGEKSVYVKRMKRQVLNIVLSVMEKKLRK